MSDEVQPTPCDDAEMLRQFLAERDVPCPVCGYNLRGSRSPQCSECGAELRLHLAPQQLQWRTYGTALIGLASASGIGLFAMAMDAFFALLRNVWTDSRYIILHGIIATVSVGSLVALLTRRRQFHRLSRRLQVLIAIMCCCVPVCAFAAMLIMHLAIWGW